MVQEVLLKVSFLLVTFAGGDYVFDHNLKCFKTTFFKTVNLHHKAHFKNSKMNNYLIYNDSK